jgi:Fe-S cluster assembly protein SufD
MIRTASETEPYLSAFAERGRDRGAEEPAWLGALRRESIESFESSELPTGREEAWRQTPVGPVAGSPFRTAPVRPAPGAAAFLASARLAFPGKFRLVLVDGRFAPALSALPSRDAGFFAGPLAVALRELPEALRARLGRIGASEARPFLAMNAAFFEDAAVVRIPAGVAVEEPIHVVHLSARRAETEMTCSRTLIVADPGSRATVVETFLSSDGGAGLTSAAAEAEIGDGAALDHLRVQAEGPAALHLGALDARLGAAARFASHALSLGARWARVEVGATLAAAGAECILHGLYLADGARHVDHRTSLDHAVPEGTSRQLYKGILGGTARAVFNGKILVRPDAQGTNAFQSNRNLLLSRDALVFTRPQLEIYANDVKCTHGATVGQLDPEALFYLRSRGLGPEAARHLLIRAFIGEVLERIPLEAVRERLEEEIASRLPAESGPEGVA